MRLLTGFILLVLLFAQSPSGEDVRQLTARAISENRPELCEKAKEECYEGAFEISCTSAATNRFLCYREYAFAKDDSSICEKIPGESNIGHSNRDVCFEHYASEKKDIGVCEKLNSQGRTNKILYASCIESVQRRRGDYVLDDCLKIKDLGEPYTFAQCIAGVAKQTKDFPLCERIFSESKVVDFWGNTLVQRCLTQAEAPK
jgi:hypothetical protein